MQLSQDPEGSGGHCGIPLQAGHTEHEDEPGRGECEQPGPAGGSLPGGPGARQGDVCRGQETAAAAADSDSCAREMSQPGAETLRLQQQHLLTGDAQEHAHQVR